ncbi:MAG: hypothetical protein V1779_12270 [bacterium]
MKKRTKIINGNRVTITDDNLYLNEDLPDELDFSTLKIIDNPFKSLIKLDDDVAQYFKSARQVNDYLRKQIKLFKSTVL